LVPGLATSERRRRKEYVAAKYLGSSPPTETDGDFPAGVEGLQEAEEFCFLSPKDVITLSLEYFKR